MDYRELWADPDFLEMVAEYVEFHTSKCDEWDFATSMNAPDAFAAEVHKIAGSAGMYGFNDVTDAARALEKVLRDKGSPDEAEALFKDLKTRFASAARELNEYRAKPSS